MDLNSSFRKPYEILLIARKSSGKESGREQSDGKNLKDIPKQKVIIAVPGYHSQKPCLKGIISETQD